MYIEFLNALVAYITAINKACESIDESNGVTPYVDQIPVLIDDTLCGFISDEIGGQYQYRQATPDEMSWWDQRPWKKTVWPQG